MLCKHCKIETPYTGITHFNRHEKLCENNPKRQIFLDKLAAAREKAKLNPSNHYIKAKRLGLDPPKLSDATREKLSKTFKGKKHTAETRQRLSDIRREFLRNNPDQHPWKRNDKFKSVPCENLKTSLRQQNIQFEEEHTPLEDHAYAIDIAFPEIRVGVEVNGEQHYNRDGTLRDYYAKRHEQIEKSGWRIIELHYARCYEPHLQGTLSEIRSAIQQ